MVFCYSPFCKAPKILDSINVDLATSKRFTVINWQYISYKHQRIITPPLVSVHNTSLTYFLDGFCKQSLGLDTLCYLDFGTAISLKNTEDDRLVFSTTPVVSLPFAIKMPRGLDLTIQYVIDSCLTLQYGEPHHAKRVLCRRIIDVWFYYDLSCTDSKIKELDQNRLFCIVDANFI